jgi:hypothetical protein
MTNYRIPYFLALLSLSMLFWTCTDLSESPFSSVTPDNFYQTEAELIAAVVPVYSSLLAYSWGEGIHMQEVSSDEIFVPTRGGDWDDGGKWRELQEHNWTPTNASVDAAWGDYFTGVARANSTLENLRASTSGSALISTAVAEVRVLRAFYYWLLMDLYGGVPIVITATTDPDNPPAQNTRQQVFDFIITEVTESLPDLETTFAGESYGRLTLGAANTFLATVYLNAEVYTGTAAWSECVAACDAVINSGLYELLPEYADNFLLANEGPENTENILVVGHKPEGGVSFVQHMASLHYNQLPQTPWNGFSVLADFYNSYDPNDVRFVHMLAGPQFVLGGSNTGDPALDRQGNRLDFTVDSPLQGANESNGVRILKWEVDPNASGGDAGNDFAIFRYPHVLLSKAEALNESNGPTQESIDLINSVRERCFDPDNPLVLGDFATKEALRDAILDERGFETLWEGFRRQDLVRTGKFLEPWTLKAASDGDHRLLFPVPQTQIDANPNLNQNPGY